MRAEASRSELRQCRACLLLRSCSKVRGRAGGGRGVTMPGLRWALVEEVLFAERRQSALCLRPRLTALRLLLAPEIPGPFPQYWLM